MSNLGQISIYLIAIDLQIYCTYGQRHIVWTTGFVSGFLCYTEQKKKNKDPLRKGMVTAGST